MKKDDALEIRGSDTLRHWLRRQLQNRSFDLMEPVSDAGVPAASLACPNVVASIELSVLMPMMWSGSLYRPSASELGDPLSERWLSVLENANTRGIPLMKRWTDDADSVPGLVPLYTIKIQKQKMKVTEDVSA